MQRGSVQNCSVITESIRNYQNQRSRYRYRGTYNCTGRYPGYRVQCTYPVPVCICIPGYNSETVQLYRYRCRCLCILFYFWGVGTRYRLPRRRFPFSLTFEYEGAQLPRMNIDGIHVRYCLFVIIVCRQSPLCYCQNHFDDSFWRTLHQAAASTSIVLSLYATITAWITCPDIQWPWPLEI